MATSIPPRSKIDKKYKWNSESVFPSDKAWEKEVEQIIADIPEVKKHQGGLGESAAALLAGFQAFEAILIRAQKAYMYASFSYSVNTTDQTAAGMRAKAGGMYGQVASAVSFLQPELLEIGKDKLDQFFQQEEKLGVYKFYVENLFRKQAHVR